MKRQAISTDKPDNYDPTKASDNDGDEEDGDEGVALSVLKWTNELFWYVLVQIDHDINTCDMNT